MLGPGHPYYPPPPPPPPKPGLSPLAIVLIVLGGVLVLGGGACALGIGVLAVLAAGPEPAEQGSSAAPSSPNGTATAPEAPTELPVTARDEDHEADPAAAPRADEPGEGAPLEPTSSSGEDREPGATKDGTPLARATNAGAARGTSWWCTASASVRVCGFAGACTYQMVFGNGTASDRFLASQQAKHACEASARAKGAAAVCVVQCSPR